MNKNETAIHFKLDADLKEDFFRVSRANSTLPSRLLRNYVRQYVEENDL